MESPPDIERIKDETLRNWAMELNAMWKNLCRVIPDEVDAFNGIKWNKPILCLDKGNKGPAFPHLCPKSIYYSRRPFP